MPKFVLNRDRTVSSIKGHTIEFKKGVSTFVPNSMIEEVLSIGATPEEELPEEEKQSNAPTDQNERDTLINAALRQLIEKNDVDDFTAAGQPKLDAISTIVGFKVTLREFAPLWDAMKKESE